MNMRRYVEAKVQRDRYQEAKQAGLEKMLWETNILAGHGKAERSVEKKRLQAEQETILRELMTDHRVIEEAQNKEKKKQVAVMEEKLANELERRNAERIREAQNRKRICESSEELRSLKEKLHAAQVTKERAAQIMEKQMAYEEEQQREELMAAVMEEDRLKKEEAAQFIESQKAGKREEAMETCLSQIRAREAARVESRIEFEKERAQVEDVVRKIMEEDLAEAKLKKEKQDETRKELQDFAKRQAVYRKEQEARAQAELEEIEAYARAKREREERIEAEKKRVEEEKKRIFFSMVGEMEAKSKEAEELEYLRNELYHEEHEAELREKERKAEEKRNQDRAEMLRAYEQQMAAKEEKMRVEREEEEKLRAQLLAKFAEDDRIEQMNQAKRRMKVQEHKREVEKLVEARRLMFEEERGREMGEYKKVSDLEEERMKIIEEERQRLLREYASELKDFLPKGVVEREADIPLVYGQ